MKLKVKKLDPKATIPSYAHPGEDACFDLHVRCGAPTDIFPANTVVFGTGLAFEVPKGYVMKVHVRSSVGIKRHLVLSNGTGIIDSGYRGELHIALTNIGHDPVRVEPDERVAQGELCPVLPVEIEEAEELAASERGTGGIGSTGRA